MLTINIDPVLVHIGHFMIRWYSLIVTASLGLGVFVASREAKRKGLADEDFFDGVVWVVIAGLIGARLFHVIDHWPDEFAANPVRVLYIWEGGLAIWGAVVGGLAALALFARVRGLRLGLLADIAAPGLVLGQAVGRTACIITGDAMGKPTTGPFGIAYANPGAMVPQLGVYYTPMPVYEIAAGLTIFALIWRLRKRDWPDGLLFLVYLSLYSIERFFLAFTSSYQIVAFGLTQSQIIALIALAVALPAIAWMQTHRPRATLTR
jgi:phosphatidylglycerol:prolipoprotein diacylglycerol transferase